MFYDAFSQDMFLGHLPYPAFYAPGPAYGNFGTDPITRRHSITTSNANGTINPGGVMTPVYAAPIAAPSNATSLPSIRNIKTPYMENYNLNVQQQISSKTMVQIGYVGSQGHRLFAILRHQPAHSDAIWRADCRQPDDCNAFTLSRRGDPGFLRAAPI